MSLIAQMNRDLEQAQSGGQNSDLPLFAAAEAIHRRRRRGSSLLLVSTVLVVPVALLAMAIWITPQSAGMESSNAPPISAAIGTAVGAPAEVSPVAVQAVAAEKVSKTLAPPSGALQNSAEPGAATASVRGELASAIAQTSIVQAPRAKVQRPSALITSAAQPSEQAANAAQVFARQVSKRQVSARQLSARQLSTRTIAAPSIAASTSKIEMPASMPRAHASRGDFIKAASVQSDGEFDANLVERAQRALRSGDAVAAREVLRRYVSDTVAVTQNLPDSAALYATLLVEDGAHERAQRILDMQLSLHPAVASLQISQLRLLVARGRYAAAVQWVASLTGDLPRSAQVMELHAVALQANGDYSAASDVYQQLLGKDVGNARWWMGLAVAFDSNAQASEAKRAYQRALALQNLNVELGNYAQQRVAVL